MKDALNLEANSQFTNEDCKEDAREGEERNGAALAAIRDS
jgi:hypothetical protein